MQLHRSALLIEMAKSGDMQRLDLSLGLVKLTMNENYLLFLASLSSRREESLQNRWGSISMALEDALRKFRFFKSQIESGSQYS